MGLSHRRVKGKGTTEISTLASGGGCQYPWPLILKSNAADGEQKRIDIEWETSALVSEYDSLLLEGHLR